ncbi:hypothetical protein J3A83DRAFT_1020231 [Scleroderma citrinum]
MHSCTPHDEQLHWEYYPSARYDPSLVPPIRPTNDQNLNLCLDTVVASEVTPTSTADQQERQFGHREGYMMGMDAPVFGLRGFYQSAVPDAAESPSSYGSYDGPSNRNPVNGGYNGHNGSCGIIRNDSATINSQNFQYSDCRLWELPPEKPTKAFQGNQYGDHGLHQTLGRYDAPSSGLPVDFQMTSVSSGAEGTTWDVSCALAIQTSTYRIQRVVHVHLFLMFNRWPTHLSSARLFHLSSTIAMQKS